eukprot:TRINITY_DN9082_c0_g1_i1.p2 TRINITY_DN9082_c0_g1~~TRINITY_DN9082_c0_g1_i1.p2  ORF type:complete len:56 (-),score=13.61 TRINITY_DN9082_c0_g1_i1:230-397(-)
MKSIMKGMSTNMMKMERKLNQTLYDREGSELEYDEDGMLISEQPYDDEGTAIQGF